MASSARRSCRDLKKRQHKHPCNVETRALEDLQGLKADIICLNEVRPGGEAGREIPTAHSPSDQVKRLRLKDGPPKREQGI